MSAGRPSTQKLLAQTSTCTLREIADFARFVAEMGREHGRALRQAHRGPVVLVPKKLAQARGRA